MTGVGSLFTMELLRLRRRRWVMGAILAAAILAAVVVAVAAQANEGDRLDTLRIHSTTLLLLGGLIVALTLGATAVNRDSDRGHFGLLLGSGMRRPAILAAAVLARLTILALVLVAALVVLQVGAMILGLGADGALAAHTGLVAIGLVLTLCAATAGSTVVPPAAAALFGIFVFAIGQAMVNLKNAIDQGVIGRTAVTDGVDLSYFLVPHVPISSMMVDLQANDRSGPALPRLDINGNEVLLVASPWPSIAWAILWCGILLLLAWLGFRRRPVV